MAYKLRIIGRNRTQRYEDPDTSKPAAHDDRWYSPILESFRAAQMNVTPETAVGTTAVYACVAAISQIIGSLPLVVYEKQSNGGRRRAAESSFYRLFTVSPNGWMTPGEWVEVALVHMLMRGNAYNYIVRDRANRVAQLVPLNPQRMTVVQAGGVIDYLYEMQDGRTERLPAADVLHLRCGLSDGVVGRSPITVARQSIGITIASEKFASRLFDNHAMIPGVLSHPTELDDEAYERIRDNWKKSYTGLDNAFKVAILEEGMTYQPVALSGQDAQFVEQRRFQLEEAARLFRVPPHIVGDLSRATFSNIEHQAISFVVYSLSYYFRRIEQTLLMRFFAAPVNGRELYAEFLLDALLRGDIKTRQESQEIMRRNGVLSANEWRKMENLPPTDDGTGDKFLVPMNMRWAEQLGLEDEPNTNDTPTDVTPDVVAERFRRCYFEVLKRFCYKENEALARFADRGDCDERTAEFAVRQRAQLAEALEPVWSACAGTLAFWGVRARGFDEEFREFWELYSASQGKPHDERAAWLARWWSTLRENKEDERQTAPALTA